MPGGIHLLLGFLLILLTSFIPSKSKGQQQHSQNKKNNTNNKSVDEEIWAHERRMQWVRAGIMIGSIIPDADLIVAIVAVCFSYLFLGYTTENIALAESLHRSWSHSLIFWVPMLALFSYWMMTTTASSTSSSLNPSKSTISKKKSQGHAPTATTTTTTTIATGTATTNATSTANKIDWIGFMFGLCLGIVVHVLSDTSYMKGVRMFWPLYNEEIFFEIPWLCLYGHTGYSPVAQKLIMAYDHFSEVPIYMLVFWLRKRMIQRDFMKSDKQLSSFTNDEDRTRVWKALLRGQLLQLSESEWVYVFRYVMIAQTGLVFLFWFIGAVVFPQMEFVHFFVLMYFPGTVFMLSSLIAPFTFQHTFRHMSTAAILSSIGLAKGDAAGTTAATSVGPIAGAKKIN